MNQKWISEEVQFYNATMDPGDPALARMARKAERLPAGKHKTEMRLKIAKAKAREFAAGWDSFRSLVGH
jgi:hypothetical protein